MPERPIIDLPKIRTRGPLAEKVYTILKDAIISGKFASGMWLQEEALTQALDVSRTPVREAFNRLKSDGFIEVIPRKGAHIIELSDEELDDLFEVREKVETIFFIRSAQAIPVRTLKRFHDTLKKNEQAMRSSHGNRKQWDKNRRSYLESDRALHDSLIKATGNKYWERVYCDIRDRIEIIGNQLSFDLDWFDIAISDHYAILESMESGDFIAGQRAMQNHIRNVRQGIVRIRASRKLLAE